MSSETYTWERDNCPSYNGDLGYSGEKRPSGGGHHQRLYQCGQCGREVWR